MGLMNEVRKKQEQEVKERIQQSEPENSLKLSELETLIQEQIQTIQELQRENQTLQSQNSKLQSSNREKQSALMKAQDEIELLMSRAASVNEAEIRANEALKEAEQARAMSDKALNQATKEREAADRARAKAYEANEEMKRESEKRAEAQEKVRIARGGELLTQARYRALFAGVGIFTVVLAILTAYEKRNIFPECGAWFADRGANIKAIGLWFRDTFMGAVTLMGDKWSLSAVWCYVIVGIVSLILTATLFLFFSYIFYKIGELLQSIQRQYDDGVLKAILSGAIAISLLYVCLYLYEPIKSLVPLNILSVWLILSLMGGLLVNLPEIIKGVKRAF